MLRAVFNLAKPKHSRNRKLKVNNLPASAGDLRDTGSIPRTARSPGVGNANPLQYSCWEIPWTEEPGGIQSMRSQESDTT